MRRKFDVAERLVVALAKTAGLVPKNAKDVVMSLSTTGATWQEGGEIVVASWTEEEADKAFPRAVRDALPREHDRLAEEYLAKIKAAEDMMEDV